MQKILDRRTGELSTSSAFFRGFHQTTVANISASFDRINLIPSPKDYSRSLLVEKYLFESISHMQKILDRRTGELSTSSAFFRGFHQTTVANISASFDRINLIPSPKDSSKSIGVR